MAEFSDQASLMRRTIGSVLVTGALLSLAACGDSNQTKSAAKPAQPDGTMASAAAPASAPPAAPAAPSAPDPAAAPETATTTVAARSDKNSDVMKWLQLLPDKAGKPTPAPGSTAPAPTPAPPPLSTPIVATVTPIANPAPAPPPVVKAVAPAPAPAPAPVPVEAPRPTAVATAAPPSAVETPKTNVLKLVTRQEPIYPREALREGIHQGHVRVKLSISAEGSVTGVEVIDSMPHSVFDRSVVAAVKGWKYSPMSESTTTTVDFEFNVD